MTDSNPYAAEKQRLAQLAKENADASAEIKARAAKLVRAKTELKNQLNSSSITPEQYSASLGKLKEQGQLLARELKSNAARKDEINAQFAVADKKFAHFQQQRAGEIQANKARAAELREQIADDKVLLAKQQAKKAETEAKLRMHRANISKIIHGNKPPARSATTDRPPLYRTTNGNTSASAGGKFSKRPQPSAPAKAPENAGADVPSRVPVPA